MDAHAKLFYEEVRNRKGDAKTIAKNTGFSVEDVETIKRHVFFNEYDLDEEGPRRFDPSYDMAVSWQRLIEGKNILEMDVVMLEHEALEIKYMNEGMDYERAHELANKRFNYAKYTNKLDKEGGVK
jgi:hypothetical protein